MMENNNMYKRNFEIKTRIMRQPSGKNELVLTVKNGWKFWDRFYVRDSRDLRAYLKSDEFKEYAYSVFSKYEGMTYTDMCELWRTDNKADFQKIWEKLDRFAWRRSELDTRDFDIKITKHERLDNNGGIYVSYMYLTGRITDRNNSRYRPFRVIVGFCIDDVYINALGNAYYEKYEDYDDDTYAEFEKAYDKKHKSKVSDKTINEYVDNIFYDCYAEYINSYADCKEFYQICNGSIDEYNNRFRRAA